VISLSVPSLRAAASITCFIFIGYLDLFSNKSKEIIHRNISHSAFRDEKLLISILSAAAVTWLSGHELLSAAGS
jgi:hypothetical protein